MNDMQRILDMEAIKRLRSTYWYGLDNCENQTVQDTLSENCTLNYEGSFTDPITGQDFLPYCNVIINGSASYDATVFARSGIRTIHQGHQYIIDFDMNGTARSHWVFTDYLFFPEGQQFSRLTGHGHYEEFYSKENGKWLIAATRVFRSSVSAV